MMRRSRFILISILAVSRLGGGSMNQTGEHDYVVVGAGAAGCVIANRLTENPGNRVMLLEAGDEDTDPRIIEPASYRSLSQAR